MKKLVLFAFAAISFTAISCKQEAKSIGEPTTVAEDSVNVDKAEIQYTRVCRIHQYKSR